MTLALDASAILALLLNEPGSDRVDEALADAIVSSVNLSEVVAKLSERGVADETIRESTDSLVSMCQSFDSSLALDAGMLRSATRQQGLSLGDRACLALAIRENAKVLTADKVWADLDIGVEIEVIR